MPSSTQTGSGIVARLRTTGPVILLTTCYMEVPALVVGALPSRISVSRRRKFHSAGITLIAFTVLRLAKYLTHAGS